MTARRERCIFIEQHASGDRESEAVKDKIVDLAYAVMGERAYAPFAKRAFRKAHGRAPVLTPGKGTFSDRVLRRKLFDRDPRMPALADKVAAKGFVERLLGPEYVIPTIWEGQRLTADVLRGLSPPFVVKANHGSGWNLFVTNGDYDAKDVARRANGWLRRTYGRSMGEWVYRDIPPRLLIEPFMAELGQTPTDYKVFVFGGRAAAVQVDVDRVKDHRRRFYTLGWEPMPVALGYPLPTRDVSRPPSLDAIVAAAETLGRDFDFIRADFYDVGRPLFGEVTFYPGSGSDRFDPIEWDARFGDLWAEAESAGVS